MLISFNYGTSTHALKACLHTCAIFTVYNRHTWTRWAIFTFYNRHTWTRWDVSARKGDVSAKDAIKETFQRNKETKFNASQPETSAEISANK